MVFWLYVGLVLAVPPFLVGLALAVMYPVLRKHPEWIIHSPPPPPRRRSWWWRPWWALGRLGSRHQRNCWFF